MRNLILLAVASLIGSVLFAQAENLKDCNKENGTPKQIACLQENIILANRAHEAVEADLRKNITELTRTIETLKNNVDTLSSSVKSLPNLDSVVIQWKGHPNSCITYQGSSLVQLVDTCVDPNRNEFVIRKFNQ